MSPLNKGLDGRFPISGTSLIENASPDISDDGGLDEPPAVPRHAG